jgi:ATP-dependent Zn protease
MAIVCSSSNHPLNHPSDERRRIAYHEAGHAVVGCALGFEVTGVSIVPDGDSLGHVTNRWSEAFRAELSADDLDITQAVYAIEVLRAGRAAEVRLAGHGRDVAWGVDGSDHDEEVALRLAGHAVGHVDEVTALLTLAGECAKSRVRLYWRAIQRLADMLLEHGTLDVDTIAEVTEREDIADEEGPDAG